MAYRNWVLAVTMIAAAAPALASREDRPMTAPPGTADTRYCMKIYASTGTLIEVTKCWTREEWTKQGVDVDKDWPKEGVRTIG